MKNTDIITLRFQAHALSLSLSKRNRELYAGSLTSGPEFQRINALWHLSVARHYRRSGMLDSARVRRDDARTRLSVAPDALRSMRAYL